MQLVKSLLIGVLLNVMFFATNSNAQYIQTRGSYAVWKQYTPIDVYHSRNIQPPIWQHYTPISVYQHQRFSNRPLSVSTWQNIVPQPLFQPNTSGIVGIAVESANQAPPPMPGIPNRIPDTHTVNDVAVDIEIVKIEPDSQDKNSVVEIPSTVRENESSQDAANLDTQQSQLKVGHPAKQQDRDSNTDKIRNLENELVRKTKLLESASQDRDKLKKLLEQQILNAINEKQKSEATANKIEKIMKQIDELRVRNERLQKISQSQTLENQNLAQQLAAAREALASALDGKASQNASDGPMTLGELAEIKRREREKQTASKSMPVAESIQAEMKSELTSAIEAIRDRFERKVERAREQDNGDQLIAKLEIEMEVQIKKIKERIENRFLRRIEAARDSSKK